nr:hypothetical protein [Streptomyces tsukubensis NRRL18488]
MLAGGDAVQHLDGDAALEEVVEDDQPFEEVAAEAVDFLDGEYVAVAEVVKGGGQAGPVVDGELAADPFLEDLEADRTEGVVLAPGLLLVGADADQSDERPGAPSLFIKRLQVAI